MGVCYCCLLGNCLVGRSLLLILVWVICFDMFALVGVLLWISLIDC